MVTEPVVYASRVILKPPSVCSAFLFIIRPSGATVSTAFGAADALNVLAAALRSVSLGKSSLIDAAFVKLTAFVGAYSLWA